MALALAWGGLGWRATALAPVLLVIIPLALWKIWPLGQELEVRQRKERLERED